MKELKTRLDSRMDTLTQEVYSAEFSSGKLFDTYGGKPVRIARDEVAALMIEKYQSTIMYEFDNRSVVCRCGSRVYVKILHDQWFLQYSDPKVESTGIRTPCRYDTRTSGSQG